MQCTWLKPNFLCLKSYDSHEIFNLARSSWQWCICEASSFLLGWSFCSVYVATLLFFATLQIFFATFAENHFLRLAIGVMSDIGRVQTSKELVVTCKPRTKWSYWQHAVVPWQQPCYLEVCHKAAEISTSWLENFAYFPKISTWVPILHIV